MYFNSKMVRLEGRTNKTEIINKIHFNSKMVRLEESEKEMQHIKKSYFNSKMVRLEVQSISATGAITAISIPKWYD